MVIPCTSDETRAIPYVEPIFRNFALNIEVEILLEEIATDLKKCNNFLIALKLIENEGERKSLEDVFLFFLPLGG